MHAGSVTVSKTLAPTQSGLRQALALDRWVAANPRADHLALAEARERLLSAAQASIVSDAEVDGALARIAAVTGPQDLPIAPELMRLLVDTLAFRHGLGSRARAWALIGVSSTHGRRHIAGKYQSWPLWFTLREYALGRAEPAAQVIAWARA